MPLAVAAAVTVLSVRPTASECVVSRPLRPIDLSSPARRLAACSGRCGGEGVTRPRRRFGFPRRGAIGSRGVVSVRPVRRPRGRSRSSSTVLLGGSRETYPRAMSGMTKRLHDNEPMPGGWC
jgi:hypothetical protein